MISLLGIALAIVVFMVIVGLHEFGHFAAARHFGVRIFEFGLGIPPRAWNVFRDKNGTDYTLNWLPLGGFVRLKGEAYQDEFRQDTDALFNKPIWQQMIIVLAGIVMNFLTAWFLFSLVFYIGVKPLMFGFEDQPQGILSKFEYESILLPTYPTLEDAIQKGAIQKLPGLILSPLADSVASNAGILDGDVVVAVDGTPIDDAELFIQRVKSSSKMNVLIQREGRDFDILIAPKEGKIGSYVMPNLIVDDIQYPIGKSLYMGYVEMKNQIILTGKLVGYMVHTLLTSDSSSEKQEVTDGIGGPIAVGNVFVGMAQQGIQIRNVLIFGALISISLGVFNLLPIPALDGGRFFVLLINGISRTIFRKDIVGGRLEGYIHAFGFLLMIALAIFIAYKDVMRIIG